MGKVKTFAGNVWSFICKHPIISVGCGVLLVGIPAAAVACCAVSGLCSKDELEEAGIELGYNHM